MKAMTLEELLSVSDDKELLDIYTEIESRVVPATGYAHAFIRRVNRMIDAGKLCVREDSYRKVYMPTLAKAIMKEMASRYANYARNMKAPEAAESATCAWCKEEFDFSELHMTDLGLLCDNCIAAIRSRGEQVTVYD